MGCEFMKNRYFIPFYILLTGVLLISGCVPHELVEMIKKAEAEAENERSDVNPYRNYRINPDGTYTPDYLLNAGKGEIADISSYQDGDSVLADYEKKIKEKQYAVFQDSEYLARQQEKQLKNLTSRNSSFAPIPGKSDIPPTPKPTDIDPPFSLDILRIESDKYPEKVEIYCSVRDYRGGYVSGLAPPYNKKSWQKHWRFVLDSCKAGIKVEPVAAKEVRSSTSPNYNISFLLDYSGSMGYDKTEKLLSAAIGSFDMIKPTDWVGLTRYHTEVLPFLLPTANIDSARSVLTDSTRRRIELGGTKTYKAVDSTISLMKTAPDTLKKIMILFTDGSSADYSKTKLDKLFGKILDEDVTIYTIAYGYADPVPMVELAQLSGGRFYHVLSSQEFPYVFKDILANLNNHYKITFKPPVARGIHKAVLNLDVLGDRKILVKDSAYYDCSLFGNYARIGSKVFMNIEFETGSAELQPGSEKYIDQIAGELKLKPDLVLEVAGHTDDVGSTEDNLTLSINRAEAVKSALIEKGIAANRLVPKGYGEEKPIVPNDSDENRRKNRRTEFIVLDN